MATLAILASRIARFPFVRVGFEVETFNLHNSTSDFKPPPYPGTVIGGRGPEIVMATI